METKASETRLRTSTLRKLVAAVMLLVLLCSLVGWYFSRDTLPRVIRIATAAEGGLYFRLASLLQPHLEAQTGCQVKILATRGSVENRNLVLTGGADLGIFQTGTMAIAGLGPVAPLYRDVVHVVVRNQPGISVFGDLAAKNVTVGMAGSGMRISADTILEHYRLLTGRTERYFTALDSDPSLDAAIVTTGLLNPDLVQLLAGGDFHLLSVPDREALVINIPHFSLATIPRGLYHENPPIPAEDVHTVASTTFLAVRADASGLLVASVLQALYDNPMEHAIPTLVNRAEAAEWNNLSMHPAAHNFFQPFSGLGILAALMESLAALKELLFAIGAGLYLAWVQWQRMKSREHAASLLAAKDRLDCFLSETMRIERAQQGIEDPDRLRALLDEVTKIKLEALEELTLEELRGDQVFAIFLQQCAYLASAIQAKVGIVVSSGPAGPTSPVEPAEPLNRQENGL